MDTCLCRVGALALICAVAAAGILGATELTAKSKLMAPARKLLLHWGVRGTVDRHRWWSCFARFASDAWICPFCTSFWHAFWVVPLTGWTCGASWLLTACAYMPAVGLAKVLHDRGTRSKPPAPTPSSVSDVLRRLQ